ncbi:MAG: beta-L-arabinofuranosidase domain-containing protein [Bacteroidota bacterium]
MLLVPALLLVPVLSLCGDPGRDDKEKQVLKALEETAGYISRVLINEEGYSRCDYNLTEGKWYEYEPAWHTGQAIYALTEAYRVTGREEFLETATRAGDWWVGLQIKDHPKLEGMIDAIHGDHAGQVIVFATVSDGTAGLYKLHEVTGVEKYAEVPTEAGDWMLHNMCLLEEGVCYDNVDPETGEVLTESSPFWPDKEEIGLYDVARPNNEGSLFLDMYQYTGNEEYKEAFITLCNSLVEKQGERGIWMDFMPNFREEGSIHPRFNLWYAESLIYGYELTGDRRYLEAAEKTARTFAEIQDGAGTIYYKNYLDGRRDRSSVTGSSVAFSGILWLRLREHGIGGFDKNIELSLDWILKNRFAQDHPDPNLAGAVINTRLRHRHGKLWYTLRDVGSSFGTRFLASYYDYTFGEKSVK